MNETPTIIPSAAPDSGGNIATPEPSAHQLPVETGPPLPAVPARRESATGREALTPEQRLHEVGNVARRSLVIKGAEYQQAVDEWEKSGKKGPKPELSTTRAFGAADFCRQLQSLTLEKPPTLNQNTLQRTEPYLYLALDANGNWQPSLKDTAGAKSITTINATAGENGAVTYACMLEGQPEQIQIGVAPLQDAQLLAEGTLVDTQPTDNILTGLDPKARQVVETHLAQLQAQATGVEPPEMPTDITDTFLHEVAGKNGMIRVTAVESFIDRTLPASDPDNQTRREALLQKLKGRITVDPADVAAVMSEAMPKKVDLQSQLADKRTILNNIMQSQNADQAMIVTLTTEINALTRDLAFYQQFEELTNGQDPRSMLQNMRIGMEQGTIAPEAISIIESSLANGSTKEMMEALINSMIKDPAQKEKAKEFVKNGGNSMFFLGGLGLLLALLFMKSRGGGEG